MAKARGGNIFFIQSPGYIIKIQPRLIIDQRLIINQIQSIIYYSGRYRNFELNHLTNRCVRRMYGGNPE